MKNNSIIKIVLLVCLCLACDRESHIGVRTNTSLNKNWSFQKGDTINQSLWEEVHIPHTPKIEPLVVNNQWQGVCWYRKELSHNLLKEAKNHFLKFEGVMQESEVWINQHKIGHHKGGYLPFTLNITPYLKKDVQNVVLVKVTNTDHSKIPPGKPLKELDFNTYGGIYRNVHLISTNNIYISEAISENKVNGGGVYFRFDDVSKTNASGFVKIHLVNKTKNKKEIKAVVTLRHKDKQQSFVTKPVLIHANNNATLVGSFSINTPQLWSPETPNLYQVEIALKDEKDILFDKVSITTGIRSIELNKNGFFLNGKKRFINGTNRHQEYPYVGYAISDNANYRDAYKIKQAGFNFVRLSHYPQSKSFIEACDQLGLMLMNCIPGWQYFEEGEFEENAFQDIKDLVRRDRNHPSMIFWENSLNESAMTHDFMVKANQIVKQELPYNDTYTAGWIDHNAYNLFIPARQHSNPPHYWNNYNNNGRQIFIAEYGDWEYYAHNAGFNQKEFKNLKSEERTSRQLRAYGEKRLLQQALNYQEAFNSNLKGKNTIGHANWLMFDYNRGYADDLEASGISDIFRIPKFANYFFKSQKSHNIDSLSSPMVHIASHWNKNSSLTIKVFSNCEEVALYLNNNLISKKAVETNTYSTHLKHPPFLFNIPSFTEGTLKAIGYINGKNLAEHSVTTPQNPNKISLEIDESGKPLKPGDDDLVFIYAKITDQNGHLVNNANHEITFSIENHSQAKIIGPTKVKAEAGIASILLRTYFTNTKIQITAKAQNLTPAKLQLFH